MKYETLILFRPLVTNRLNQTFGQNDACINPDTRKVVGKRRDGTCPAGYVDLYREEFGMDGHNGLDLGAFRGEKIFKAGTFTGKMRIEHGNDGGIGVDIVSLDPLFFPGKPPYAIKDKVKRHQQDGVDGFLSHVKERHWHCLSAVGYEGKIVKFGETIALADSTGASSGDHDHFGMKFTDQDGTRLDWTPNYTGAFDPMPFIDLTKDAKTMAEELNIPPAPLTYLEQREIQHKVTLIRRMLLYILEQRRKI